MIKETSFSRKVFSCAMTVLVLVALMTSNIAFARGDAEVSLPKADAGVQESVLSAPPAQSSQTVTVDDLGIMYTGGWVTDTNCTGGAYNTTCSNANSSGSYATYAFTGSAVTIYSRTANNRGKMNVYLDGTFLQTVDLYTSTLINQNAVYSTSFSYGEHVLMLEWAGTKNPSSSDYKIFVDKITYTGDQNTVDNTAFTYTGTWLHDSACGLTSYNNTCSNANSSGAYATYTFTGSTMMIFARTAFNRGEMNVYLDNVLQATVDLYSSSVVDQKVVYSSSFSYGTHTVKLEWAGTKNASSSDYKVFFDKMIYTNEVVTVDDDAFTYTGVWYNDNNCVAASHNNTCSNANSSGAYATYTFTGSAMTIYSRTAYNRGNMDIYLDNNLLSTVDLYTAALIDQNKVYFASFPYGTHTVKLQWNGTKNANSSDYKVFIDKMTYFTAAPTPTPTATVTNTPTITFTSTATATFVPTPTGTPPCYGDTCHGFNPHSYGCDGPDAETHDYINLYDAEDTKIGEVQNRYSNFCLAQWEMTLNTSEDNLYAEGSIRWGDVDYSSDVYSETGYLPGNGTKIYTLMYGVDAGLGPSLNCGALSSTGPLSVPGQPINLSSPYGLNNCFAR